MWDLVGLILDMSIIATKSIFLFWNTATITANLTASNLHHQTF